MQKRKNIFWTTSALLFFALALGKNTPLYSGVWQTFALLRVPARFYFLTQIALVILFARFWNHKITPLRRPWKILLLLLLVSDLYWAGHLFIWNEPRTAQAQPGSIIWQLREDTNQPLISAQSRGFVPGRIFTTHAMPTPNKTMLAQLENANGYEAVLQGSLQQLFYAAFGLQALNTTGIDAPAPDHVLFDWLNVLYFLHPEKLASTQWHLINGQTPLKIYTNPNPSPGLFSAAQTQTITPEKWAELLRTNRADKTQIYFEANATQPAAPATQYDVAQLLWARKIYPQKIESFWQMQPGTNYALFLSEAHYPGWHVYTEKSNQITRQANGYFQSVTIKAQTQRERVVWIFAPTIFYFCAAISAGCCVALFLFFAFWFCNAFLFARIPHVPYATR